MTLSKKMLLKLNKIVGNNQKRYFFKNPFGDIYDEDLLKQAEKRFGKYDIITKLGKVSPKRPVPSYIPKPEYAEDGIPPESPALPEIKNENQIECMRHSCILAKRILRETRKLIKPGITTDFLDLAIHEMIINNGAYPSPLNYREYPKSICTSINNVACHGIPDDRILLERDILNIDITVYLNGYHGDCSEMFKVGHVDEQANHLINVTELCLMEAINICKPNERFSSIGTLIEEIAGQYGFSILPAFVGHGIGTYFHGPPDIYHTRNGEDGLMKPGMTFTIEPVLSPGGQQVMILEDGWTAVTTDHARSAQIEHTVLITENGCDILSI